MREHFQTLAAEMNLPKESIASFVDKMVQEELTKQKMDREERAEMAQQRREEREHELRLEQIKMENRDKDRERDMKREELKLEEMRLQIQKLEMEKSLAEASRGQMNRESKINRRRLPFFNDKYDEIDSYLNRFELHAQSCGWDKSEWAAQLQDCLQAEALDVLTQLPKEEICDYEKLKTKLLSYFASNAEGYNRRFRECKPEKPIAKFFGKVRRLSERWVQLEGIELTDGQAMLDLIRRENVYRVLHEDVVAVLKQAKPKTFDEMETVVDNYIAAHPERPLNREMEELAHSGNTANIMERGRQEMRTGGQWRTQSAYGAERRKQRDFSRPVGRERFRNNDQRQRNRPTGTMKKEVRCFNCDKVGHYAKECTRRFEKYRQRGYNERNYKEQQERKM